MARPERGLKCSRQLLAGGEPLIGSLGEAAQAHLRDLGRHVGQCRRVLRDDLLLEPHRVIVVERQPARQHLVQQDAERPEVAASVEGKPLQLLGRGVGECGPPVAAVEEFVLVGGDAEVADVRGAVAVEQDVRRLDVSVDDALAVGVVEGAGGLSDDPHRLLDARSPLPQPLGEVGAVDQVRDDEVRRAFSLNVVDRDDAGVPQPGDSPGFRQQEVDLVGVNQTARLQDLDRDVALEAGVVGPPDLTVAALADQPLKGVPSGQGAARSAT